MARPRTVILDQDEDIVSYEHHIYGKYIRILVGFGTRDSEGNFTPSADQNYEQIVIVGDEYDAFIAGKGVRPSGEFRREDLWEPVDFMRADVIAKRNASSDKKQK